MTACGPTTSSGSRASSQVRAHCTSCTCAIACVLLLACASPQSAAHTQSVDAPSLSFFQNRSSQGTFSSEARTGLLRTRCAMVSTRFTKCGLQHPRQLNKEDCTQTQTHTDTDTDTPTPCMLCGCTMLGESTQGPHFQTVCCQLGKQPQHACIPRHRCKKGGERGKHTQTQSFSRLQRVFVNICILAQDSRQNKLCRHKLLQTRQTKRKGEVIEMCVCLSLCPCLCVCVSFLPSPFLRFSPAQCCLLRPTAFGFDFRRRFASRSVATTTPSVDTAAIAMTRPPGGDRQRENP